jgi:2-oxo-3-hexenedioate decarboxylase
VKHEEISNELWSAWENVKPIPAFSGRYPDLSVEDAYLIQNILSERAVASGDSICGYKMGLTSKAKQRDVQVFEPIRGFLRGSFEIPKNGTLDMKKRIHPRVEPEVAVVLKSPLSGANVTLREVRAAIHSVLPALEIVDSRYENFSFRLADVIADNTSAAAFMVGSLELPLSPDELRLTGVFVRKNGRIVETGAPAAVLGDPFLSVLGLVKSLATEAKRLEAGMVVLTGGITNSIPLQPGDRIEVVWPGETLAFEAV